jgi:hypothetical protein
VLTAAWRRPRAARGRAARAQLVGRKLAHPAVPSPSLSVRASSTQPTSCLLNPILRGYTLIVFLLFPEAQVSCNRQYSSGKVYLDYAVSSSPHDFVFTASDDLLTCSKNVAVKVSFVFVVWKETCK